MITIPISKGKAKAGAAVDVARELASLQVKYAQRSATGGNNKTKMKTAPAMNSTTSEQKP